MRLPKGAAARLVLTDGTTLEGSCARSWQWGVHRLEKVTVYTRGPEGSPLLGRIEVDNGNVMFAQIYPPGTET